MCALSCDCVSQERNTSFASFTPSALALNKKYRVETRVEEKPGGENETRAARAFRRMRAFDRILNVTVYKTAKENRETFRSGHRK